jgi:hypothetical protein
VRGGSRKSRFQLGLGAHTLGATADGAPCILAASLDLRGGFVEWSEAWTTAPLSGRGSQGLRHRRVLEGGATVWTTLEVDEGGRFSVRAPCGAGHVTRGDTDRPWLEPASEVLALDLPQKGLTGLVIEE